MARRPRLCFIGWGDHVHTERWVSRFVDCGFDLSVISFSGLGNYPPDVRQFSIERMSFDSYRLRMLLLRALLHYLHPDLVHVHYAGFLVNVAPLWSGPLVVSVWGSDIYRAGNISETEREQIARHLARAACVTCDSADLQAAIAAFSPAATAVTEIVQWGVDTELFTPGSGETRIAAQLGLAGRLVFISPRNFYPLYRLTDIVQAFARVADLRPDAVLLMKRYNVDPVYAATLETLIDSLGVRERVHILDRVEYAEMVDFYRSGRIMLSVPESDGTPMSLLEAMACGCIPIVSDLPSLREWVVDGVNGRLVPVGDVEALTGAMLEMADLETREEMVARNLALVRERASLDASRTAMLARYRMLLAG